MVISTIVGVALDESCTKLETTTKGGSKINKGEHEIHKDIIKKHKRVIFNGDNYTEAWVKEAKKRGLPNLKTTPEALKVIKKPENIKLFERQGVLTKTEMLARYEVYMETYETIIQYEASLAADMAKTTIIPVALDYQIELAETIKSVESINKTKSTASRKLLKDVSQATEAAITAIANLETALKGSSVEKMKSGMDALRKVVDTLEGLVPAASWPLPSYAEMLFIT